MEPVETNSHEQQARRTSGRALVLARFGLSMVDRARLPVSRPGRRIRSATVLTVGGAAITSLRRVGPALGVLLALHHNTEDGQH